MAGVFRFHDRVYRNKCSKCVFFVEQVFEKGNFQATLYFSDTSISPEIHFFFFFAPEFSNTGVADQSAV